MALQFDPAIEAQTAFQLARAGNELGPDWDLAQSWEATFSEGAGEQATEAYRRLLALGERHADAHAFQEFLIYSTWQQAAEDMRAEHFQRGLDLCDKFLTRGCVSSSRPHSLTQVRELRTSFAKSLGIEKPDEFGEEYDRDTFKGGD